MKSFLYCLSLLIICPFIRCKKADDVVNFIRVNHQGDFTSLEGGHYFSGSYGGGSQMNIHSEYDYDGNNPSMIRISIQLSDADGNEFDLVGQHTIEYITIMLNDNHISLDSTIVDIESQEFTKLKGSFSGYHDGGVEV